MLLTKFQPYLELDLLIHSTCVCFAIHEKLKKSHYLQKQSQLDFRNSLLDHLYFFLEVPETEPRGSHSKVSVSSTGMRGLFPSVTVTKTSIQTTTNNNKKYAIWPVANPKA